jgi:hypothetical protein
MSQNIHVLELSAYTSPVTTESKRDNWVEYGEDNNYFQFLIDRFNYSTTNGAIINNISKLVYGRGLSALDGNKKPNEYAQMKALFSDEDLRKIVMDRKMLGQFAFQLHYNDKHDKIIKAFHIPLQLLRAEKCNEEGEIQAYYYSDDWTDTKKYKPKRIPAFGYSKEKIEILYCKPYTVGLKYYANVDYIGGLPYALLEQEVADYLINEVQNGFSGTKVVNFNNGTPTPEEQEVTSRKVLSKLTGSRGQKVIIAFNDNVESKTTVDDIPLNDAPDHYTYLSEEAMRKIMLAHNVTSPLLFGIASTNGFSSNADELRNSSILFDNMVVKPLQDQILEGIYKILAFNGISLKLYFDNLNQLDAQGDLTTNKNASKVIESINSLSPLVANKVLESMTSDEVRSLVGLKGAKEEETGQELHMSSQSWIDKYGEHGDDNWLLVDAFDDDGSEEFDFENVKLSQKIVNLVKTGKAVPIARSEQDEEIKDVKFFTRYRYTGKLNDNSRDFCKAMLTANKLYRKEDIEAMSKDPQVNKGWGPKGADTYDLFKYKGGGDCHHIWRREVYATLNTDAVSPLSKDAVKIATSTAEKRGYKIRNPFEVSIQPRNLPFNGFLPTNKRFE